MGAKRKSIRKKRFRKIAAAILVALAAILVWFALSAPGYIKRHINEYILESSKGEYQLYFSEIKANLYTQTIRIDSVRLIPQKTNQTHYSISSTQLKASGISIFDFLLHKQLTIELLQIKEPEFEIFGTDGQKRDAMDKKALFQKLKPFFDSSLKSILIGDIKLEQAHLAHYKIKDHSTALNSIRDLDIGIRNFRMDSSIISKEDEFFNADDIYLKIVDFNRMLGDSIHHLKVAELTYSIENRSITGKDMYLYPTDTMNQSATYYWIKIPEIKLKSNDLRDILGNDSVRIDSVVINNSDIRVKPNKDSKQLNFKELKKYDLYELIKNDFNYIRVNHLDMQANRLYFEPKDPKIDNSQLLKGITIKAINFEIDSLATNQTDKVLYSDNFKLKINSYLLKLNDQVHEFRANNLEVSSFDSLMKAESISLTPTKENHNLPVTATLNCDSLIINQINLPRLFHFREMPLRGLTIYQPELTLTQLADNTDNHHDEQSLLYQFIRDYIKGVYANLIAIENGHLEFNDYRKKDDDGHISVDFDFKLTDFSLDSASARQTDKLFFATNLELTFKNYEMKLADQLHMLTVKEIKVSSLQSLATIQQLHLFPDKSRNPERALRKLNRSELYDIKIPYLSLQNTDIHHAFFRKKLNINHFKINQPKIYFEVFAHQRKNESQVNLDEFYDLLNNYITDINIHQISIEDGDFQFINHSRKGKTINLTNSFSLNMDQFRLNENELHSNRMLFSDAFDLTIKDHLFKLSDNVHYLKASEISFNSSDSIATIKNALLYPEISSPDYNKLPWHIQISVPRINLNKIDLEKVVFHQTLDAGSFEILSPRIQLYQNRKGDEKFNFRDLSVPLPEEVKELTLESVNLKDGKLSIYKSSKENKQQLLASTINLELKHATLKRTENNNTARFSSESIETNLQNLQLTPSKVPYAINIQNIHFSSVDQLLDLKELNIKNNGDNQKQILSIYLPRLQFEKLDPTDAFDHNRFHASRIVFTDPVVNLRHRESTRKANPLYVKLTPDLNAIMDELSAGLVQVNDASFNIIGEKEKRELHHVDIELNEFMLDSTISTQPLGAKDLTITRRNIQYTDNEKLYDLLIDRFMYTTTGNNMSLTGLHIIPRYGPDKFQQFINYQQDYYSGDIHQIKFENIDLDRWFERHEFTGKNIDIDQINLLIYRDKRQPLKSDQHPPLLQDLIRNIDLPFYFDSVKLSNSNIIYNEQIEETPEPGRVSFEKLEATLYPFTNLKYLRSTQPEMHLNASTKLMGASELKARFTFDMNSVTNRFSAKGSLSPFDLTAMNPITENAASISVRSGQLNRFEFEFSGDSVLANGKLRFAYDDLKIYILAHKNGNTKEAKFLSFLANSLMLKSKNPRTRILLPDDIHYYRDPNKSTLNYWWKTVFSGAKNTFGVKEE
ncbi:hypothetical protein [Mangrovibacterium lignilyticum]|uniref:hypothetical protein n=1 Tax=Mangrovibacterium lignilyticum TaxID=2668052 RepID=UPI0013D02879|nr:hypothetical protein [Mangrovibacterium lignilyticum]